MVLAFGLAILIVPSFLYFQEGGDQTIAVNKTPSATKQTAAKEPPTQPIPALPTDEPGKTQEDFQLKTNAMMALAFSLGTAAVVYSGAAVAGGTDQHGPWAKGCDAGFHYAGPAIGCLGETITDRGILEAFDKPNAGCKPGEKRTIDAPGVMPSGRKVIWKVVQTCK